MTQQPTASSTSLSRLQELLPQLFQSTQLTGQPHLRFMVTEGIEALISMEHVQESLIIEAEQITPIPNMAPSVLGLMHSRDQVFCVVNLPQLLGYSDITGTQRRYRIIVVRVPRSDYQQSGNGEILLGLAVPQIQGVTRLQAEQLQTDLSFCPATLSPYVTGTYQLDQQAYIFYPPYLAKAQTLYSA